MPFLPTIASGPSPHDAQRVAQVVLLTIVGAAAAFASVRGPGASTGIVLVALLATGLAGVSWALAASPTWALREIALAGGCACLAGLTATAYSERFARRAMQLIVLSGGLYALVVVVIWSAALLNDDPLVPAVLFPGFSNVRFFNHVQTVVISMGLALLAVDRRRPAHRMDIAVLALHFALLWMSAGRATLLALLAGAIASMVVFRLPLRQVCRPWLSSAGLGAMTYVVLFRALPWALGRSSDLAIDGLSDREGSNHARLMLARQALRLWEGAPWFGIGPMHFAHVPNGEAAHPHDLPLQLLAEWGLPMLLLAAFGVVVLMLRLRRAAVAGDAYAPALGIGAVAVLVDSLFSGSFVMPAAQLFVAIMLGLAVGCARSRHVEPQAPRTGNRIATTLIVGSSFALQCWTLVYVLDSLPRLDAQLAAVRARVPTDRDNPRFWSDGWF